MGSRFRATHLFYLAAHATAALIAGAVLAAPWLSPGEADDRPGAAVLRLFAQDAAVRRIGLVCAAGLAMTAQIFFRPTAPDPAGPVEQPRRSSGGVGA
jgi:hypothetical protein